MLLGFDTKLNVWVICNINCICVPLGLQRIVIHCDHFYLNLIKIDLINLNLQIIIFYMSGAIDTHLSNEHKKEMKRFIYNHQVRMNHNPYI